MITVIRGWTILVGIDDAIYLVRTIMFDLLPDPIQRLLTFVIFIGIIYAIRNIVHLGGGD
jgi:hypothetical protein